MKTIGFSHKKHKANESQEKMTVTSGKDVCLSLIHIFKWTMVWFTVACAGNFSL